MIATLSSNTFESSIFVIVFFAWILSDVIGAGLLPRLRQKGRVKTESDQGSMIVIRIGIFASFVIGLFFASNGIALLPEYFFYIGISLMILGIIIRQWAIRTLGQFFSLSVKVMKNHRVVDDGPYKVIRHPSYTGTLLTLVGFGISLLQSWAAVLIILIIDGLVFGYRINVEESVLKKNLGNEYLTYMKRTKRLFPYLF